MTVIPLPPLTDAQKAAAVAEIAERFATAMADRARRLETGAAWADACAAEAALYRIRGSAAASGRASKPKP